MPLAGQSVSGVRLVRPIGRGSHSQVYFGVGENGQPCAVKIFPPHLERYAQREYANAHTLDHPRLVQVMRRADLGEHPVLITTLARGEVMLERYRDRPAARTERRAFLLTLAHLLDAVGYLHARGLVHRDIKPENILVEPDGGAKLVDFDLSGPAHEPLQVPTRYGTAAFQSPEAARGEPLGPESDLYGVGVLLAWGVHGFLLEPDEDWPPSDDPLQPLCASLLEPQREHRQASATLAREELLRLAGLPY